MRLRLFSYTLLFAALTAVIHLLALRASLYWIFPWLDCIVHFLGGAMTALLLISLVHPYISKRYYFTYTVLLVFCVGVGWEVFEYLAGITSQELDHFVDTLSDLLFDILGGLLGGVIAQRILESSLMKNATHDGTGA